MIYDLIVHKGCKLCYFFCFFSHCFLHYDNIWIENLLMNFVLLSKSVVCDFKITLSEYDSGLVLI